MTFKNNLLSLLSLSSDDDDLQNIMFKEFNIDIKSGLSFEYEDTLTINIEKKELGIEFVFVDESAFVVGRGNMVRGTGRLFLGSIFLYNEGKNGFSQYSSCLPMGLDFSDSRKSILKKLGNPDWQRLSKDRSFVAMDRWDNLLSEYSARLCVSYSLEEKITVIAIEVPDETITK